MRVPAKVSVDVRGLLQELDRFQIDAAQAGARALNRAVNDAQASAVDRLARNLGVAQDFVRKRTWVRPGTPQNLEATLGVSGKATPLIQFGAVQTPVGVTFTIGSGVRMREHAFTARMPSGHVGVFRRAAFGPGSRPERRGPRRSWLPIREQFGPSVATAFLRPEVYEPVVEKAMAGLEASFKQEIAAQQGKR